MQNKLSHILSICWKVILPIKSSTRSGTDIPGQIFLWSSWIEGNTRSILVWKSRALVLMKSLKMRVATREESHRVWEALPSIGTATSTLRHCPRAEIEIFMAERRMTDPLQPSGNKILVSGVDTNIITIILSAHPTNQNTPKDLWQRKIKYPQIGNCWTISFKHCVNVPFLSTTLRAVLQAGEVCTTRTPPPWPSAFKKILISYWNTWEPCSIQWFVHVCLVSVDYFIVPTCPPPGLRHIK